MFPWEHASELEVLRCVVYFALSGCSDPDDSPIAQSEAGTRAIYGIRLRQPPPTQSSQRAQRSFACLGGHHGQQKKAQDACLYSDGLLMSPIFGQNIFAPAFRMERFIRC